MGLSPLWACLVLTQITIHVLVHLLRKHKQKTVVAAAVSHRLPPGPVKNAFFFYRLLRHNPHRSLARLAGAYGPVASFRSGWASPVVVVSSPAAAREALAQNDALLAARWVPECARAHSSNSPFFLPCSNPLWRQNRVTVSAHFSSAHSLESARPVRERQACHLAEHFRACSGREVTIGDAVFAAVSNAVSSVLFSKDLADMGVQSQVLKDLVSVVADGWSRPNISDAFPLLAPLDLLGMRRRIHGKLGKLYSIIDKELKERQLNRTKNRGDLMEIILARSVEMQLSHAEISKFFTDIFMASTDTTAITVQWAMARLLRHPDKMEKLRAELDANLGSKEFVEEGDLEKLPYLHAVVMETLRLHPPVPFIPRMVVGEDMSLAGFNVPIGSYVLVNYWAIGRDPVTWPNPEQFQPERFLGPKAAQFRGSDYTFKPFGAGRRVCPGLDMAARFVPLLLASILHRTQWSLPNGMLPEDIDLRDKYGLVLELATPLRAVPRSTL